MGLLSSSTVHSRVYIGVWVVIAMMMGAITVWGFTSSLSGYFSEIGQIQEIEQIAADLPADLRDSAKSETLRTNARHRLTAGLLQALRPCVFMLASSALVIWLIRARRSSLQKDSAGLLPPIGRVR